MKALRFCRFAAIGGFWLIFAMGFTTVVGFPIDLSAPGLPIVPPGPAVRIVSPANCSAFYTPVDIPIFAFTHGFVYAPDYTQVNPTNVEIFATNKMGIIDLGRATRLDQTNSTTMIPLFDYWNPTPFLRRFHTTWCLMWSNAPMGTYALIAVASGRSALSFAQVNQTSAPVQVTILSSTLGTNAEDRVSVTATDPIAIAGTNISWVWPGITNTVPGWTNWPPPQWGYCTNWGPKPAVFTVRRFGDASAALTVNYKLSGNASNGVDYAALPGYVNVPAGSGYALIPIVPIDNGSNNFIKTVVLTLAPPTNTPAYWIGVPKQAEALISYRWVRLPPIMIPMGVAVSGAGALPDGSFHLSAAGPEGAWFVLQTSTDLVNWTCVETNQVIQGSVDFADPSAPGSPSGYYQVVPLSSPPTQ